MLCFTATLLVVLCFTATLCVLSQPHSALFHSHTFCSFTATVSVLSQPNVVSQPHSVFFHSHTLRSFTATLYADSHCVVPQPCCIVSQSISVSHLTTCTLCHSTTTLYTLCCFTAFVSQSDSVIPNHALCCFTTIACFTATLCVV